MSIKKTKDELTNHKNQAVLALEQYINQLIESTDDDLMSKSDKLSYWINDWVNFLSFEERFSPRSLRRYKRGEIIKVHLGFNIGSEEGGLHYAVVLDKNNAKSSPTLTIVPLTSVKPTTDVNNLGGGRIFLGNELFTSLQAKISATEKHLNTDLKELICLNPNKDKDEINKKIKSLQDNLDLLKRIRSETMKMKRGSIALTGQITTISKIRIYDPKTDHDILSNIKLSNEKLDLIDQELAKRYTNIN